MTCENLLNLHKMATRTIKRLKMPSAVVEKEDSAYENWNGGIISTIMEDKLNNRCVTAITI
ncbi:hypothetical protein L0P88_01560 [Muricauda sp. SCSIO 64092]|uniref:hypothetical protein n=1 Tax=Allomuricauda sp. SCSIO 64092 TaxID=2908842 RepID=UPI001FF5D475|nr:hypothetical protein [Muricauda sp. SCSIO 64092]UOY07252.1 hypothetical protein L0P88_01560 [Muricauda sp. SCSIO 64092]